MVDASGSTTLTTIYQQIFSAYLYRDFTARDLRTKDSSRGADNHLLFYMLACEMAKAHTVTICMPSIHSKASFPTKPAKQITVLLVVSIQLNGSNSAIMVTSLFILINCNTCKSAYRTCRAY
jgi:hypothetical protein